VSKPIRVVIADDHAPTRSGVRTSLEHGGFEIVGEAGDATAAVDIARRRRPDVCLLDIHMPGSGIAAATRITDELPDTAVVMLTVSRNDDDLFDALRAGASGYLLKDTDPARLPFALRGVLSGEAALPRTLVARLIDEFRDRGRYKRVPMLGARGAMLTSREWEVLELLREGLSTKEIAERLFLAPATIRSHVAAILRKLRVPDRAAAIRMLENGANSGS
jgi:DNA-binding NarL/FixJ family response regulator